MSESKGFDETLNQFHDYLSTILKVYQDIIIILKQELDAVNRDDIGKLNGCLKDQQALCFRTKNFNLKIKDFQSKLGITARNLSETIQLLPENNRLPFFDILGQFELTSSEVRYYQEKCRTLLQSKLYMIDKALTRAHVPKGNIIYNEDAAEVQKSLFAKTLEIKF